MRQLLTFFALAVLASCGGSGAPATPTPAPRATYSLSGFVFNSFVNADARVAGARVEITQGSGSGQATTTDTTGSYRFDNLESGELTLRVSLDGYQIAARSLTLATNSQSNIGLTPDRAAVSGSTFNAVTLAPMANVTVAGGTAAVTTDNAGLFTAPLPVVPSSLVNFVFTSPQTIERQTTLRAPGANAAVSLLPTTFDLVAFNQMFRAPFLMRPRASLPVRLEMRAGTYKNIDDDDVVLNDIVMSDAEATALIADLSTALPQLTGGTIPAFTTITRQTSPAGSSFHLLNNNAITIIRVRDMDRIDRNIGLGQCLILNDGTVVGGMMMLDFDWDRSTSPFVFAVRAHELGHALGMSHVTSRSSFMNPVASIRDILPLDREAARVAYQRPPGNRAPDIDPQGSSVNALSAATWGPRIR